jgi:predicted adenine nucleotide alpha hydrolase (AANH) superfamily ATPase
VILLRRILLHTCCGPCGTHPIEVLEAEGLEVVLFFSNSNIAPVEEYLRRLDAVRCLATQVGVELLEDEYDHGSWLSFVAGLEDEPERGARCEQCFRFNLARTAARARAGGFSAFTTTLTVSPHKPAPLIFRVGNAIDSELFLDMDFKKRDGYRRSVELSRRYGLYRQRYCGCEFSLRDSRRD